MVVSLCRHASAVGLLADMRQAFLNALPAWWFLYCCRVTKDGEHPNDLGTDVEATAFSQVCALSAAVTASVAARCMLLLRRPLLGRVTSMERGECLSAVVQSR
jgi:hypothetical protein